jgi:Lrp/AsnC family transcriptional regulator, regulator for asnA, asnC and gidA
MKDYEIEIINHLREGVKMNMSEIARKLKIPITTVIDRIKRIEDKYVLKHSVLLDYKKLGYSASALLAVKLNSDEHSEFLDFLKFQKNVNTIMKTNSNYNYLVEIICKDNLDYIKWIEAIKSKYNIEITPFQILDIEDRERFVP